MTRVCALQHVPFESIGQMRSWFDRRGCDVRYTRLYAGDPPPTTPTDFDLIVVAGGPMSANDDTLVPWLAAEKEFLRRAVTSGVPVLGICLGAQLIASALGARVFRSAVKEIGWFPVRAATGSIRTGSARFAFPQEAMVFHWHGDTFDLPEGATLLASSAGCRAQAFQIGSKVIGLQFHLEMSLTEVCLMVEHCHHDLVPGRYVQDEPALLNAPP